MSEHRPDKPGNHGSRDERLRAALRANLQRRKAQARARADQRADQDDRDRDARGGTDEDDS